MDGTPRDPSGQTIGSSVKVLETTATTHFEGWMSVEKRRVRLPDAHETETHVVIFPDIAVVVAADETHAFLIRQYRFPPDQWIIEAPAGRIEPGEDSAHAAARELLEETGLVCESLVKVGELRLSPHLSCE